MPDEPRDKNSVDATRTPLTRSQAGGVAAALADNSVRPLPHLAPRFDACEELARFVWSRVPRRDYTGVVEPLVAATFARTLKTYHATLRLAEAGYGEQACMLTRSMFEDLVVAFWVREHPD